MGLLYCLRPVSAILTMNVSGSTPDIPHENCKQYSGFSRFTLLGCEEATTFSSQPVQVKFTSRYEPKTKGKMKSFRHYYLMSLKCFNLDLLS